MFKFDHEGKRVFTISNSQELEIAKQGFNVDVDVFNFTDTSLANEENYRAVIKGQSRAFIQVDGRTI